MILYTVASDGEQAETSETLLLTFLRESRGPKYWLVRIYCRRLVALYSCTMLVYVS